MLRFVRPNPAAVSSGSSNCPRAKGFQTWSLVAPKWGCAVRGLLFLPGLPHPWAFRARSVGTACYIRFAGLSTPLPPRLRSGSKPQARVLGSPRSHSTADDARAVNHDGQFGRSGGCEGAFSACQRVCPSRREYPQTFHRRLAGRSNRASWEEYLSEDRAPGCRRGIRSRR